MPVSCLSVPSGTPCKLTGRGAREGRWTNCIVMADPIGNRAHHPVPDLQAPVGVGNGVRTSRALSPVQALLRLVTGEGAGDWRDGV